MTGFHLVDTGRTPRPKGMYFTYPGVCVAPRHIAFLYYSITYRTNKTRRNTYRGLTPFPGGGHHAVVYYACIVLLLQNILR